jgi:hypothetical protein
MFEGGGGGGGSLGRRYVRKGGREGGREGGSVCVCVFGQCLPVYMAAYIYGCTQLHELTILMILVEVYASKFGCPTPQT